MNKIITLCLLIICVIVTGCGNSAGSSNSLNNTPVIYNVTPSDSSSIAQSVDSNGNLNITLTGVNFGSSEHGRVYYNGYTSETSSNPQSIPLTLYYGGSWTDNSISVNLVKSTRETYPNGSFYVVANGQQSPVTPRYNFGSGNLSGSSVTSIQPSVVYGYNTEQNYIAIEGNGFGITPQDLLIFNYNGYSKTITKDQIYNWTNTRIVLPLPISDMANSITSNTTLYIRPVSSSSYYNYNSLGSFEFKTSQITYISPAEGSIGKVLTVTGQGFGSTQSNMYIYIGDSYANVVSGSWTENSFQVRVPSFTSAGSKSIRLRVNGNELSTTNFSYEVKAPMFYSISKYADLSEGDNVTIYGSYFGNKEDLQAIYQTGRIEITDTNNNSTNVISMTDANVTWTDNSINFLWPKISSNLLSTKTFNIKVIVGSLASSNSINVTD